MSVVELQEKRRMRDRGGGSQIVIPLTFHNDWIMIIELLQIFLEPLNFIAGLIQPVK